MTRLKSLMVVIIFHFASISHSQEIINYLHYESPPAPNAAGLAKYGDVPVGFYSGTPEISIPIYTINHGSLSVPIVLSYHAGGVKVDDIASWVGLGWSLNAGGTISRVIRGRPDELEKGFFIEGHKIDMDFENESSLRDYYKDIVFNEIDSESDSYNYSYPSGNGKFAFDYNKNIFFEELKSIRLDHPFGTITDQWLLTDTYGHKYFYGSLDKTHILDGTEANSSWHLDDIVSADGKYEIHFDYYEPEEFLYSMTGEESIYVLDKKANLMGMNDCNGRPACEPVVRSNAVGSEILTTQRLLSRITAGETVIDFIVDDRTDLGIYNGESANRLSEIIISNNGNIRRFVFNNDDYFGSGITSRLKLNGIQEFDGLGNKLPPFKFTYNEDFEMPERGSFQVDHWGFFNSNLEDTFLPSIVYDGNVFMSTGSDGNREADTLKSQTYILTDITYPTGGWTHLDYEPNWYGYAGTEDASEFYFDTYTLHAGLDEDTTKIFTIDLTEKSTIEVTLSASCTGDIEGDGAIAYARVFEGGDIAYGAETNCAGADPDDNKTVQFIANGSVVMEVFSENWGDGYNRSSASASVKVFKRRPVNKLAGGVRIKRMTSSDGLNLPQVKRFQYMDSEERSSGVLVKEPAYSYLAVSEHECIWEPTDPGDQVTVVMGQKYSCDYNVFTSNSKVPLGEGEHIGYRRVKELHGENGENGSIMYEYTTAKDYPQVSDGGKFPFPPARGRSYLRGRETKKSIHDVSDNLVSETTYEYYEPNHTTWTKSIKVGFKFYTADQAFYDILDNYNMSTYLSRQEWTSMKSKKDKTVINGETIETESNYLFDGNSHLHLTQIETKRGNESRITKFKYPEDYVSGISSGIDNMVLSNIVAVPIEEQQWYSDDGSLNSTMTSGVIYEMNVDGKPEKLRMYEGRNESVLSSESATDGHFNNLISDDNYVIGYEFNYDSKKDLISQRKAYDVETALIWDETLRKPMAEVTNASPDQIAYSSFETEAKGGWNYTYATADFGYTGKRHYQGSLAKADLPQGTYTVQLWAKSFGPNYTISINGNSKEIGQEWKFHSWDVVHEGGTLDLTVTGTIWIDEARLFPINAQMQTYLFHPMYGITEMVDTNGNPMKYEYDSFGRLKYIRDKDGKPVSKTEYFYQGN